MRGHGVGMVTKVAKKKSLKLWKAYSIVLIDFNDEKEKQNNLFEMEFPRM